MIITLSSFSQLEEFFLEIKLSTTTFFLLIDESNFRRHISNMDQNTKLVKNMSTKRRSMFSSKILWIGSILLVVLLIASTFEEAEAGRRGGGGSWGRGSR